MRPSWPGPPENLVPGYAESVPVVQGVVAATQVDRQGQTGFIGCEHDSLVRVRALEADAAPRRGAAAEQDLRCGAVPAEHGLPGLRVQRGHAAERQPERVLGQEVHGEGVRACAEVESEPGRRHALHRHLVGAVAGVHAVGIREVAKSRPHDILTIPRGDHVHARVRRQDLAGEGCVRPVDDVVAVASDEGVLALTEGDVGLPVRVSGWCRRGRSPARRPRACGR